MNTTITKDQMILHDGEVYVFEIRKPKLLDYVYLKKENMLIRVQNEKWLDGVNEDYPCCSHSTAKLDGVIQLPREWFVRGEDIEELADKAGWEYSTFDQAASAFSTGFKAGYNAKKGEFTREQMITAIHLARIKSTNNAESIVNELQPIYLPQSITLNKDNEIVKIEW